MAGSSFSGGSFTASVGVDSNQGIRAMLGSLDATVNLTGLSVTLPPGLAYSGMTVFNGSTEASNYLRLRLDYAPGVTVAPGDDVHLIPPGGVASISFDSDVIDGFTVQVVTPPPTGTVADANSLAPGIVGVVPFTVNLVNG
jgi:hypothetical protein